MKKLLSIIVLGLLLSGCSEKDSYEKTECEKYGYVKNSEKFKNCIKDDDHFFAYGLAYKSKARFKEVKDGERLLKSINKIDLNINYDEYENIDYQSFNKENFKDIFSKAPKEGIEIPTTKFWFYSEVRINSPDEEDPQYSILFGSPFNKGRFHNIDIQNKIVGKSSYRLFFYSLIPAHRIIHKVYGSYRPVTGSYLDSYAFYVDDIIFGETDNSVDFIIERMIFEYCKLNNKNPNTITKIYQDSLKL